MKGDLVIQWVFIITALAFSVVAIIFIGRIQENIDMERNVQFYWFYSSRYYYQQEQCIYLYKKQEKEACMELVKNWEALRNEYYNKIRQAE